VNRDITGIPKKEYWIQMQLQMETADLNECDFFETQFSEEGDDEGDEAGNPADVLMTGTMIYFMKDGKPHYEYEPIGCKPSESEAWFNDAMERNQAHMWMKTIHWRLEKMSCVLVLRNKFWFRHAIRTLDELWRTVIQERSNPDGYEHRAPKRKATVATNATNANATNATNASAQLMHSWLNLNCSNANANESKCRIDVDNLELDGHN
jgi:hypothetical protein